MMVVWILISSLVINVAFYYCCIREKEKDSDNDLLYTDPEIVVTRAGTPLSITPASSSSSESTTTDSVLSTPDTLSPDFILVEETEEAYHPPLLLFTKDLIQAPKTQ